MLLLNSKEKQMVKLSYIAYSDFIQTDPQVIYDSVSELLGKLTKECELQWGPAIHKQKTIELATDALCYIVKDTSQSDEYTIVIRGTNPASLSSWVFQDFIVGSQIPWVKAAKYTVSDSDAFISKATWNSICIHQNLIPEVGANKGKRFFDYLKEILISSKGAVRFNFTGHSLGGLMSSTMALWFYDMLLDPELKGLKEKADIHVYSFAGPTAGNTGFVRYSEKILGSNSTRYKNKLDAACFVWNEPDMRNSLPNLYIPEIAMSSSERDALDALIEIIEYLDYQQPFSEKFITSEVITFLPFLRYYLTQAVYQHVCPYALSIGYFEGLEMIIDIIKSLFDSSTTLEKPSKDDLSSILQTKYNNIVADSQSK